MDHGKSTLSDRLLELTGTIQPGGKKQVLDKLDVERERGITVKAQTCSMIYNHEGQDYLLHLVDTPGHVDFRAEVSRSYASCGGALLLVDASQGVQAQTVANFYLAFSEGLKLLPIINKIDLPSAEPERAIEQIKDTFELDPNDAVLVSARTGLNVEKLLPAVIDQDTSAYRGAFSKPSHASGRLLVFNFQGCYSARPLIRWHDQSLATMLYRSLLGKSTLWERLASCTLNKHPKRY